MGALTNSTVNDIKFRFVNGPNITINIMYRNSKLFSLGRL